MDIVFDDFKEYSPFIWPGSPTGLHPYAQQFCFQICALNFIASEFKTPEMAKQMGIQGKVVASVIFTDEGFLKRVEIIESPDPILAKELVRVIMKMPKLEPYTIEGVPVEKSLQIPVNVILN